MKPIDQFNWIIPSFSREHRQWTVNPLLKTIRSISCSSCFRSLKSTSSSPVRSSLLCECFERRSIERSTLFCFDWFSDEPRGKTTERQCCTVEWIGEDSSVTIVSSSWSPCILRQTFISRYSFAPTNSLTHFTHRRWRFLFTESTNVSLVVFFSF